MTALHSVRRGTIILLVKKGVANHLMYVLLSCVQLDRSHTLQQMRFLASVEVGSYQDDYEDVDPRLLQEYYGVSQRWRSRAAANQTGAGHSDNEDDEGDDG